MVDTLKRKRAISASGANVMTFGSVEIETKKVIICMLLVVMFLIGIIFLVNIPVRNATMQIEQYDRNSDLLSQYGDEIRVNTTQELLQLLDEYHLLEDGDMDVVPAFVVASLPGNFDELEDVETRKKAFLHTLLPMSLLALQEIKQERVIFKNILRKIDHPLDAVFFSDINNKWGSILTDAELDFVRRMRSKYRSTKASELLSRIDVVPVSLILGQGAIESSWGGSRFARTANNLFGIWTWGEQGIIPEARDEGKNHKVRIYDTVLDSVRSYILMLNRVESYGHLRRLRRYTDDSLILAAGLLNYSERGEAYVDDVRLIITSNNLQRYDKAQLSGVRSIQADGGSSASLPW
jgi:Bax protein